MNRTARRHYGVRRMVASGIAVALIVTLVGCAQQANSSSRFLAYSPFQDVWAGFWQGALILWVLLWQLLGDLFQIIPNAPHLASTDLFQSGRSGWYDLAFAIGLALAFAASSFSFFRVFGLFKQRRR